MGSRETGTGRQSRSRANTQAEAAIQEETYTDIGTGEFDGRPSKDYAAQLAARQSPLTEEQEEAMDEYGANAFTPINEALREDRYMDEPMGRWADDIERAIETQFLPENLILYRGWKNAATLFDMANKGTLNGAILKEKAFMSTSIEKRTVEMSFTQRKGGAIFRLKAKAGLNAHVMRNVGEREVLMQRGSSVKINSYRINENGSLEIEGEIIQDWGG